jgi:hypothetical protein
MVIRLLCCVFLFVTAASAQTFQDQTTLYYTGRGEGASLDVARARAYANMVEQIQVLVSSSLRTSTTEQDASVQRSTNQSTLSVSSIVLRDVQERVEEGNGIFRVVKYVQKTVVHSMFEQRRRQIIESLAAAEAEGGGTDAVDLNSMYGNYYKAWLMAGLYPDTISYAFQFGGLSDVNTGIPRAMRMVCDDIEISPSRRIDDEYTTWKYAVTWRSRPVKTLRFTFHDGLGESEEEVRNGAVQATFLFADKRERQFPVTLQYRDAGMQDALLAIADSIRAQFAPVLTMQVLLPGEKIPVAVDTTVQSSRAAETSSEDTATVSAPTSEQIAETTSSTQPKPQSVTPIPAVLRVLIDHRSDLNFFKTEISRLVKRGDIIAGNKKDFDALNGLYVLVLDEAGIKAILRYEHDGCINTATGEAVRLPEFEGKRILWVQVQ